MKTRFKNVKWFLKVNLLMGAVLISLLAVGQTYQTQNTGDSSFTDWDKDSDKKISKTEFSDRYTQDYGDEWKRNTSDEGFYETSYGVWDTNRDQRLSEDEWKYGYDTSYGDYVSDDYSSVDTNGDGYVDYNEYYGSLGETDYYSSYDQDGDNDLNDDEVSNMVFDNWDENKDGYIDENEYDSYENNYINK